MHHELSELLTITWAVGVGLIAQILAHHWRIPAIVLLLFCGVVMGPNGLGLIHPAGLGDGLPILVKLAVAVILFEGALNLRLPSLRVSASEIRNLISIGVLVSWSITTLIVHFITQLDWSLAILFGALMTVTGPTVVQPLLKRLNISRRIKAILAGEAILIDPVGAILAVAVLDVILGLSTNDSVGVLSAVWSYVGRLAVGTVVGVLMALLLSRLMKIPRFIPADLSNLVVLAGVWVAFGLAEQLQNEAGIMASVAMGLALQREAVPGERQLRHFKETLTTLSITILFVLLAANLKLEAVVAENWRGVVAILLIMFVSRPVAVYLSTRNSSMDWREKMMIAWIGPRGIVAASVASLFGLTLQEVGIPAGERLPALTFLAIILTVTIQGLTASSLVKLLKLHNIEAQTFLIVGANRLGQTIAGLLRDHGQVILLDTNQMLIERAQAAGFEAIVGNALDENVLEQVSIGEAETILAITTNPEVNVLVCQLAYEAYGIKRAFPVLNMPEKGAGTKILTQTGGRLGLAQPVDVLSWEYAPIHTFTWQLPATWSGALANTLQLPNDLLPAVRLRGKSAHIVHAEQDWQAKDNIIFLTRLSVEQARETLAKIL